MIPFFVFLAVSLALWELVKASAAFDLLDQAERTSGDRLAAHCGAAFPPSLVSSASVSAGPVQRGDAGDAFLYAQARAESFRAIGDVRSERFWRGLAADAALARSCASVS